MGWEILASAAAVLAILLPGLRWAVRHAIRDVVDADVTPKLDSINGRINETHRRIDDHMKTEEQSLNTVKRALVFIAAKQGLDDVPGL